MDFLRELRHPDNPERFVPVVVMSAYCGAEHVTRMRDVGATEFMLRPFSQEVVASRLRSIVRAPRMFILGGNFFGPDRRRRRVDWDASERRSHQNYRSGDRRRGATGEFSGKERRQGRAGFEPLERRTAQRA
ncbi:MAG: response regulator [Rhodospirillaceae bacterium]|nr:response regulator [Rhodospirillales bacterium]